MILNNHNSVIKKDVILIIDFGSQVTKLIARRVREIGVLSLIVNLKEFNKINDFKFVKGIIFSGGPSTVTGKNFPKINKTIFSKNIPILGICFGLQLITKIFGGKVKSQKKTREFGKSILRQKNSSLLTKNFFKNIEEVVWMSHQDAVVKIPKSFKLIASTIDSKFTIIENTKKKNLWNTISSRGYSYKKWQIAY